ncbi:SEC-C metal-binding domain-containing protein [Paenibacillus germinis]|uniref:SEC-C metal-binding domain-containing protein n=1 Tax=Paenibacillus germinis TaxID=2654979 RepID=UPI001FED2164|nr:SEC-C metal-binding domain-containing protein [Paenibacillus germinis]
MQLPGRNDPCSCGSGKKYKKCCINKTDFDSSIRYIKEIFKDYNPHCLSMALFAIASWLPNISANVKIHLIYKIFLNIQENEFSGNQEIIEYKDFQSFCNRLFDVIPHFTMLEDYWPEQDFGEIRFYHESNLYKVFYGGGFENSYEYLYMFQIFFLPLEQEFSENIDRSPSNELTSVLRLQEYLISNLSTNRKLDSEDIPSGFLECPSKNFYEQVCELWKGKHRDLYFIMDQNYLEAYSCKFGDVHYKELQESTFINNFFETTNKTLFINYSDELIPIFSRDYAVILFNEWGKLYDQLTQKTKIKTKSVSDKSISRFIEDRFSTDKIVSLISPINEGKPLEITYTSAYISQDEIHFVYTMDPGSKNFEGELDSIKNDLQQTSNLIKSGQFLFALRGNNQAVSIETKKVLKPRFIIVIPSLSTETMILHVPNDISADFIFLREYIAIVDEIDDLDQFSDFFVFMEEMENKTFHSSKLDLFGAFKDSNSVLIEGANDFNMVMLDTNWGSHFRYENLYLFWTLFPEIAYHNHPRSWTITKENKSIRLVSKKDREVNYYRKIGNCYLFISTNLNMSFDQARLSFFVTECLEYNLHSFSKELFELQYFQKRQVINVKIYPASLVGNNELYSHVHHLVPSGGLWTIDSKYSPEGLYDINIVFDEELIQKNFLSVLNRRVENKLITDFLLSIKGIADEEHTQKILCDIEKTTDNKPGFVLNELSFDYAVDEKVHVLLPDAIHFKKVRNKIALLCKNASLEPGTYDFETGILNLNKICKLILSELKCELSRYESRQLYWLLINQSDAFIHNNNLKHGQLGYTHLMDVDFDREEILKENEDDFIRYHKSIRYLIESSLLIENSGNIKLDFGAYKYLLALVDWLFVVYTASDSMHYQIHIDCTLEITKDFLVNVNYDDATKLNMDSYQTFLARQQLKLSQNKGEIEVIDNLKIYLDEIDQAFLKDLKFTFKNMCLVLHVLSTWTAQNNGFYREALLEDVIQECLSVISDITIDEVTTIIDFLKLDKTMLLKTMDSNGRFEDLVTFKINEDIPVWEYSKRPWRYSIRPLIYKDNSISWGVVSTDKAQKIWMRGLSNFHMPYSIPSKAIDTVLISQEKKFQDKLVDVTFQITKNIVPEVMKEVELFKIDRSGNHPRNLGDYDVLAFWEKKNIIFNIECKYIRDSYCMKDAKRDLDKIFFGKSDKGKSYISKLLNRQSYLSDHFVEICNAKRINFNDPSLVKVIPIFLTKRSMYWTKFPPIESNIVFLGLNELEEYLLSF